MQICDLSLCTGCGACSSVCPMDAISLTNDIKGFYVPEIDGNLCIKCNKCRDVCQVLNFNKSKNNIKKVLACWNKDINVIKKSTSGGIFFELAKEIISKNGIVYGASFNEKMEVYHKKCEKLEEIYTLQGSKYVQSYTGKIFQEIEKFLKNNRMVLFTGTPCQNSGLKKYLSKDYPNLFLIDIVCHGVPSPLILKSYIKYIENIYKNKIKNINFRYKKPNWTFFSMNIEFQDGNIYTKKVNEDPFLIGFLNDYFSKSCCHNCKYTNINREGDITIGDFWGYVSIDFKNRNKENGISLVLLNNSKGKNLFENISKNLSYLEKDIREAKIGNRCLSYPFEKNKKYDEFWNNFLNKNDFKRVKKIYFNKKKIKIKRKISCFINDHSYFLGKKLRKVYEQMKKSYQEKNNEI